MTDQHEPADDVTGQQPALPGIELPEYHGKPATGMRTSLTGAGSRITRAHEIDDRVVLVIEARVKSSGHMRADDGLLYIEKMVVDDLFEVPGDQGRKLLATVRSIHRHAEDMVKGNHPLPNLGDVGYTDASGVVLTPAELAELRGDPSAVLLSSTSSAVVVYETGHRDMWPDDYAKGVPRPRVGEQWTTEHGTLVVAMLLHPETGEELPPDDAADVIVPVTAEHLADALTAGEVPTLPEPEADTWTSPHPLLAKPVVDIVATIGEITDGAELEVLHRDELAGKNRPRVLKALADRGAALFGGGAE